MKLELQFSIEERRWRIKSCQKMTDHYVGNYLQQKKVIANIVFAQRLFCVYKLFKDINMLEFQINKKRLSSLYYLLTVT